MREMRCGWFVGRLALTAATVFGMCAVSMTSTTAAGEGRADNADSVLNDIPLLPSLSGVGRGSQERTDSGETMLDEAAERVPAPPFGTKDSWRWAVYGGAAIDLRRDGEEYHAIFAASHFLAKDFSVDFEAGGMYLNEQNGLRGVEDGVAANVNMLFRWHFLSEARWSLYADAGVGVMAGTTEVPVRGTNYNLTPQAGAGLSMALGDGPERLMAGIRWHHMSNARTQGQDDNPGRDSVYFYAGLSFPF